MKKNYESSLIEKMLKTVKEISNITPASVTSAFFIISISLSILIWSISLAMEEIPDIIIAVGEIKKQSQPE